MTRVTASSGSSSGSRPDQAGKGLRFFRLRGQDAVRPRLDLPNVVPSTDSDISPKPGRPGLQRHRPVRRPGHPPGERPRRCGHRQRRGGHDPAPDVPDHRFPGCSRQDVHADGDVHGDHPGRGRRHQQADARVWPATRYRRDGERGLPGSWHMAVKTGTAQVQAPTGPEQTDDWMIGFLPAGAHRSWRSPWSCPTRASRYRGRDRGSHRQAGRRGLYRRDRRTGMMTSRAGGGGRSRPLRRAA